MERKDLVKYSFLGMSELVNTSEEVILLLAHNIYKPTPLLKNHKRSILKRWSGADAFL